MNTSDVLKFLTPCAPLQLGTVGSTSDVGGIYVFVSVTNSGILTRNMPKLAFFLQFYFTYKPWTLRNEIKLYGEWDYLFSFI